MISVNACRSILTGADHLEASGPFVGEHIGSVTRHLAVHSPAKQLVDEHDNLDPQLPCRHHDDQLRPLPQIRASVLSFAMLKYILHSTLFIDIHLTGLDVCCQLMQKHLPQ